MSNTFTPPVLAISATEAHGVPGLVDVLDRWTRSLGIPKRPPYGLMMISVEIIDEGRVRFHYEDGEPYETDAALPPEALNYLRQQRSGR